MFSWLKKLDAEHSGFAPILRDLERMLDEGRRIFDGATDAYLLGMEADRARPSLIRTDQTINHLERQIRRAVVVHATVHGVSEFPSCLVLMSIAKDAERIGDESKNVLDLGSTCPKKPGTPYYEQLLELKERVSSMLAETRSIYESQDTDAAADFIHRVEVLKDECDDAVDAILGANEPPAGAPGDPVATALCFRYFKRVMSHARNIVTSVVVPVDRLDYYDESKETRDGPPPV